MDGWIASDSLRSMEIRNRASQMWRVREGVRVEENKRELWLERVRDEVGVARIQTPTCPSSVQA